MKTVFRLTLWFIGILLMPGLQAATTQGPLVLGAERMDVITRLLKDKQYKRFQYQYHAAFSEQSVDAFGNHEREPVFQRLHDLSDIA